MGLGQNGSTSKRGTCFACAAALSNMPCTTPSVARTAMNAAPVHNLLFFTRSPLATPIKKCLMRRQVYLGPIPVSSFPTRSKSLSRLILVVVGLLLLAPRISAHEVPNEVTVLAFVHPEGKTM